MSDPEARAALLRRMLVFVAAQPVGFGDWACVECRPESDMLVSDFRCLVHEARAALAALPDDGPTEALLLAVEEVDSAWNDQGDHIEWDSDALPERLIALRKALSALPDDGLSPRRADLDARREARVLPDDGREGLDAQTEALLEALYARNIHSAGDLERYERLSPADKP